mmetsp:Transcript_96384/g.278202  ORF Transcript_96384/g.278202 Transcript_96384/m.278202 type:complete len:585 (+) Transcript_96384:77-1831(+)
MVMEQDTEKLADMGGEIRQHLRKIEMKLDLLAGQFAAMPKRTVETPSNLDTPPSPKVVIHTPKRRKSQNASVWPDAPSASTVTPMEGLRGAGVAWVDFGTSPSPKKQPDRGSPSRAQDPTLSTRSSSMSLTTNREAVHVDLNGLMQDAPRLAVWMHRLGLHQLWSGIQESIEHTKKERGYHLVRGNSFQLAVCSVILLQSLLIGYGAANAFNVQAYGHDPAAWVDYFEIAFCCFFAIELLARAVAERWTFVFGSEWKWNMFDLLLVLMSFSDLVANGTQSGEFGGVAVGRILRLSRFFALMRMSRVMRQLPSLRIILLSILDSMVSLVWCFIFIGFIMYVFSVLIVYGMADFLRKDPFDEALKRDLLMWWGGLYRCIVTLFMAISGGVDWSEVVRPLQAIGGMYEPLFLFYIFLMCFGVLNVVLGAFVATTQQIAMNDPEAAAKYATAQLESYIHRIRGFFKQADVDRTGTLNWEEFRNNLLNPKVRSYFEALELDTSQAHLLFDLLDKDGSGSVSVEEFVEGCVRLRGHARSIDVNRVIHICERTLCQMEDILEGFAAHAAAAQRAAIAADLPGPESVTSTQH